MSNTTFVDGVTVILSSWAQPVNDVVYLMLGNGSAPTTRAQIISNLGVVGTFNTRAGAVTLTSGDVTTALGFTPYNATNPSNYITGNQTITVTGDVTGSGATAIALTLATVNSNVGTFGDSTHVPQVTVNGKGLVTAVSSVAISAGGTGTVTTVSVVTGNGFAGSVANATTTPAITLSTTVTGVLKGNGTAVSAAVNSDLPAMSATVGGAVPTPPNNAAVWLNGQGAWTAPAGTGTVTSVSVVSANGFAGTVATSTSTPAITLTTSITGILSGNGTAISAASTTGSGAVVLANTPTLITPVLGVATATSINGVSITGSGTIAVGSKTLTMSNTLTFAGTDSTTMTFPGTSSSIGYLGVPQLSKSTNYTTVLADAGTHIYHPSADTTARTWTIDSNSNVAYPIGTAITFVNDTSGGVITIAITSDTLVLSGAGTTGSRSLAANGVATALKVTSTRWVISGTGLT